MSKKIVAIFLLMTILFSNCALAVEEGLKYARQGGNNLDEVATIITDEIYIKNDKYVKSNLVDYTKVKIYNYNTNTEKECTGDNEAISYSENKNKYFLTSSVFRVGNNPGQKIFGEGNQYLYYTIALDSGTVNEKDVATFIYKDAITYNGSKYDVKLNIKEINKVGSANSRVKVLIGCRDYSENNMYDITTYNKGFEPGLGMERWGKDYKAEITVEYYAIDKNGNEIPITGLLKVSDIDQYQGLAINNFKANKDNTFIDKAFDSVKYKYENNNNDTYVYSTVPGALDDQKDTYYNYFLIKGQNKLNMTFTFDSEPAHSSIVFDNSRLKTYKEIVTEVVGGTITPSITNIKIGENRTINYSPNTNRQYLKSITVDGNNVKTDTYKDSYTFSNITDNHKIVVVYENKYKVEYDAKGGTPTPATEYVMPNNKATEPTTNPQKRGYSFEGWVKSGETNKYDFNTNVNSDIKLEADWKPIIYKINYVLNGGKNDSRNPYTYTIESNINFQPATREGYDFLGWYEDEDFKTPIDSISNRTGDITVYAKWQAKKNIPFKVEHYKEQNNGEYRLVVVENLSGEANTIVTAKPKVFTGYKENTTHKDRVSEGTISPDGSLVLKLFYDKEEYRVTFDPKNDTKIDDQIVKYQDKATEPTKPTKEGHEFEYWYYINDEGKEVVYNFDDPVTHNIDLIAKWEKIPEPVKEPEKQPEKQPENTPTENDRRDNTIIDNTIPYTGKTMLVINLLILVCIALAIVTGIKYKKNKEGFFRNL